jgi:hypothetical protein
MTKKIKRRHERYKRQKKWYEELKLGASYFSFAKNFGGAPP